MTVVDQYAGKKMKCLKCQKAFTVPDKDPTTPSSSAGMGETREQSDDKE